MANITLKNIRKAYDNNVVVKNVNIDIKDKEFIVLLGSSGCGKSTILRMIAGLEEISGGKLYIGDTLANDLNPSERGIAFVFQNYALYPHMTVRQNMAFALENMKFSPDEIKKRVKDAAEILKLSSLLERLPGELSGGQRQRVAIGRSIVRKPKVFLMDEPLSNLDAGLRARMREEILRLHNKLQTTFVYVTHDQTEAMTMAMRIILFEDGNIRQIGTPLEIYNKPIDKFVASFIGNPAMNFMDVNVDLKKKTLKTPGVNIPITEEIIHKVANYDGKKLTLGVRPHSFTSVEKDDAMFSGEVEIVEPFGNETHAHVIIKNGDSITVRLDASKHPRMGEQLHLKTNEKAIYFFDPISGTTLY